jgi:hypothetical protein
VKRVEWNRELADGLVLMSARYISLLKDQDPREFELLAQCQVALADLYALLVRVPDLGMSLAMTSPVDPLPLPDEGDIEPHVAGRLPAELYWSALRPLTWETVGDVGLKQLALSLVGIWRVLNRIAPTSATDSPDCVLHRFALEKDDLVQLTLDALTVLHEVVTDHEAYEKA